MTNTQPLAPTDKQLEDFAVEEQFLLFCDEDEFTQIARAVLAKWGVQPSPASQGDALDAARLDWLLLHISGAEFRRIGVHYSGNASRADVDAARKQGANHD